jgi:hypothetical protein
MDFIIRKDIYGNWWHDYNNDATKVNISDFEAVIDDVENTFIIQCFNGSNVPSRAISIVDIKVIDQNISNTPIPFSGAVGLKNLLTTKLYPPYRDSSIVYDEKVIFRKGHAVLWNETQEYFNTNFDSTGKGILLADGWALCNGNNGTKDFRDRFILNKGTNYNTLYTNGGSANSVLIGHNHDSIVFTDGRKGVNLAGSGASNNGWVIEGYNDSQKTNKTSVKGQSNTGVDTPSEDGVGKNMPPYIVAQWVERTEDLIVYYTGSEGGGGSQTWSETLENGRNTGGFNPLINNADAIELENTSLLKKGTYNFGGNGGISRICSNNYEDMWQNGFRHVLDQSGFIRNSTNCFDIVPDSSFDVTLRFAVGSFWTLDNGTTYVCTDATEGAAVWEIYNNFIPNLTQVLTQGGRLIKEWDSADGDYVFELEDLGKHLYFIGDGVGGDISAAIPDNLFPMLKGVELQGSVKYGTNITLVYNESSPKNVIINSNNINSFVRFNANQTDNNIWSVGLSNDILENVPTKTSDLINDGDNGTSHFITLEDLPSNLILYATTVASGIGSYNKLVSSITDPSYNTVAVDVSTGAITGTDQLIAGLITSPNIIVGNPGIFNITTIGNIRKTTGSGQAEFYFRVYKRDVGGTETLILQSSNTPQITSSIYTEFSATGLWNDGVFISTDMIVMKFYGTKVGSGSNPTYDFQFGGTSPIRTLVPIPLTVVPNLSFNELSDVEITTPTNNQIPAYESATSLWKNKHLIDILKTFNRTQGVYYFEEFMGNQLGAVTTSFSGVISAVSGGTTRTIQAGVINRTNQQGVIAHLTGILATNFAGYLYGGSSLFIGTGAISLETYVTIETLSTATDRFYTLFGYILGGNLGNLTNGIFFTYDEGGVANGGTASTFFRCATINASTRTFTTTSVPVVASQWYKLRIDINNAANSVGFYIDGNLVATHTTNIPATTTALTIGSYIVKTVGTGSRQMQTDYFMYDETFTNPR